MTAFAITTFSIGRSSACDIVLDDPTVSRRHAALTTTEAGTYRFVDQGSTSGSYRLEDGVWRSVTDSELHGEDRLRLGDYETTVAELLKRTEPSTRSTADEGGDPVPQDTALEASVETGSTETQAKPEPEAVELKPPRTVVERDPVTGRIVVRQR